MKKNNDSITWLLKIIFILVLLIEGILCGFAGQFFFTIVVSKDILKLLTYAAGCFMYSVALILFAYVIKIFFEG